MWIALVSAMVMPVLAGILLLRIRLNSGMPDSGPPHIGDAVPPASKLSHRCTVPLVPLLWAVSRIERNGAGIGVRVI
jgi:hypothetical protein